MKYFFDTEFIEDGRTIDLISIGIVAEDGREYYAINYDCDFTKASDWVQENVLCHLPFKPFNLAPEWQPSLWRRKSDIAKQVVEFIQVELEAPQVVSDMKELKTTQGCTIKPEFWAYYADYDWVVFCQLFGTMMDLPKNFPMYCRDIKQECDRLGNPKLPEQGKGEHNALADARWNKQAYYFLQNYAT